VCYLLQRARWRMLDYLKWARLRRTEPADEHAPIADRADVAGAVTDTVLLAELLAALSGTQRAVLVRVLRGETWREVAAALGCSAANVAYHMRRIRRQWEAIVGAAPATDAPAQ
jgi:DNA-directed RNA polymerase specialized sigma24 family protein